MYPDVRRPQNCPDIEGFGVYVGRSGLAMEGVPNFEPCRGLCRALARIDRRDRDIDIAIARGLVAAIGSRGLSRRLSAAGNC